MVNISLKIRFIFKASLFIDLNKIDKKYRNNISGRENRYSRHKRATKKTKKKLATYSVLAY